MRNPANYVSIFFAAKAEYTSVTLTVYNFSLGPFAWELSFGIFRLGAFSFGILRLGTFALELLLDNFRLGSFAWELSLGTFRFGTFAWDLSLGNFRLGTFCSNSLLR